MNRGIALRRAIIVDGQIMQTKNTWVAVDPFVNPVNQLPVWPAPSQRADRSMINLMPLTMMKRATAAPMKPSELNSSQP